MATDRHLTSIQDAAHVARGHRIPENLAEIHLGKNRPRISQKQIEHLEDVNTTWLVGISSFSGNVAI